MLSVVISAYNEGKNIKECIESIEDLADEIIVVDNSSTDGTYEIAEKSGAKVFKQENDPRKIDLQKNFGFSKAKGDWILSLDADERVDNKLAQEIKKVLSHDPNVSGYNIPRKNIIFKKWIRNSIWWPDYQLRLFKKGKGKFVRATVHQPINVKGEVRHLSEPLIHYNYSSITQYVGRMNNIYTEIEVEEFLKSGKRLHWTEAVRMPSSDFLKTYFLQKGYRDGLHGFILSILQSIYMFLIFAKVWEKQGFYEKSDKEVLRGFEKEVEKISSEYKFWMFTTLFHETRNPLKRMLYLVSKKLLDH
jgi:glycosyltransferase involved in cell wall biosynthesis